MTVGARTKTFIVMYGTRRRLRSIGQFPDLSLSDARKTAKKLLVSNPPDVSPIKVAEAVRQYLADCDTRLRSGTIEEYRRFLLKGPDKTLAGLKKTDVDVSTPHKTITWKVFCNWCIRQDMLEKNPFQHMRAKFGQRSRVLSDDELKIILRYEDGEFSRILKLCLLTGQRRTEVASIRGSWLSEDTMRVPGTIAKNKKAHTIAFNLLTARQLPETDGPIFNGFSKAKARFDRLHPFPHWTIHDLRRTFATIHARIGTPIHVVEAMLNHTSGTISGVAAIYIRHNFLAEMRKAALAYELFIAKLTDF